MKKRLWEAVLGMLTTTYKRRIFEDYDVATAKREIERVTQREAGEPQESEEEDDDERGLRAAREIMMDPMFDEEDRDMYPRARFT